MSRIYDEDGSSINPLTFPNAPCHTCVFQNGRGIGVYGKGATVYCEKYPMPGPSSGGVEKPRGILEGTKPCEFYQKEGG